MGLEGISKKKKYTYKKNLGLTLKILQYLPVIGQKKETPVKDGMWISSKGKIKTINIFVVQIYL